MTTCDALIIGASASGLVCAIEAARRGQRVIVLDHADRAGRKILMSGGGRCNFTNLDIGAENYLSENPHFCKSALSRYTQWDFIARLARHDIAWQERDHGQLFCENSAADIVDMLLRECHQGGVDIRLHSAVENASDIRVSGCGTFVLKSGGNRFECGSLVVASGGLSFPRVCASPIGYRIAEAFGHPIVPTRPGLVPLTLQPEDRQRLAPLAGIAIDSRVRSGDMAFREQMLFTHRGISGPAILQASSYWRPGEHIDIDLAPQQDAREWLTRSRSEQPRRSLGRRLQEILPKRLVGTLFDDLPLERPLQEFGQRQLDDLAGRLRHWSLKPGGSEGYRTAEVTVGGVDTACLSSRTLQSTLQPGLFFIGEVVDVTGWLGGYNFQWAWSSGWAAGQAL
jgi:predicted Rossmann fold flavoprotein